MATSIDVFDQLRAMSFDALEARWHAHVLEFHEPAETSRQTLRHRKVYFLHLWEKENPKRIGRGEAAPLAGLSLESEGAVEMALTELCRQPNRWPAFLETHLNKVPSVLFALEQALLDVHQGGIQKPFPSKFTDGRDQIPINGLIWMGSADLMVERINQKITEGFDCLKLKIGALDRREEWHILEEIRANFGPETLELRVDANGAFAPDEAFEVLEFLASMQVHSIEQPIAIGQWTTMAELCAESPVPIALDEELIGHLDRDQKWALLETLMPAYLILKPSLLGGFAHSEEWIELAETFHIGWWATSALESNLALNQLAQWVYTRQNPMPQGLGTGQLYKNNLGGPLYLDGPRMAYAAENPWTWPE